MAVEKIQAAFPKSSTDLQDICSSALLGMSARARAKGREGTKTNKGALFARINDVVDIEQVMRKEEVYHHIPSLPLPLLMTSAR